MGVAAMSDVARLTRRSLGLGLAAAPLGVARAAGFPDHPLRVVVPFPPGGSTDIVMRLAVPGMESLLGQPVVIDNRGGAGGTVGTTLVARAAPDGYTLLATASTHVINPAVFHNLPYDAVRDFAPVALLASSPFVLVVHPSLPVHTVRELIAYTQRHPAQLSYGSPGNGSGNQLGMEMLKAQTGIDILHVPYAGSAPATTALLAGQVQVMLAPAVVAVSFIQSGQLRALAVSGLHALPTLPDVPTVAETLPGFDATTWYGVLAPAGTPTAVTAQLGAACSAAISTPNAKDKLLAQGVEASSMTTEVFAGHLATELEKWSRVARAAKVQLD